MIREGINIQEFLPDQKNHLVRISFELSSLDWYEIQELDWWGEFEKNLIRRQKEHNLKQI